MIVQRLLSSSVIGGVGLACKAFLNIGFKQVAVSGIHNLLNALDDSERKKGRGIVTGE